MRCQRVIAEQIVDGGGEHVLALKANRSAMHDDVKLFLDDPESGANISVLLDERCVVSGAAEPNRTPALGGQHCLHWRLDVVMNDDQASVAIWPSTRCCSQPHALTTCKADFELARSNDRRSVLPSMAITSSSRSENFAMKP